MAYDDYGAERCRNLLTHKTKNFSEKKMFGGLCFMVDDKMCFGLVKEELMARVGPEYFEEALQQPGVKDIDFTGRPMKGYVFISPEGYDTEDQLSFWIDRCLAFNPRAKSSKKK